MIATGTDPITKLKHQLRTIRANYVANVRANKCAHDPKALAEFDRQLERLNGKKSVPAKHQK